MAHCIVRGGLSHGYGAVLLSEEAQKIFAICKWTDIQRDTQTDRHTDTLITILHILTKGKLTTAFVFHSILGHSVF